MPDKAGTMPALPEGARDTNLCQISAPMAASKRTLVIIAFAALYVIWGSTYVGIRFAIETIPPFLMAGARFVAAGLIMYVIAWAQGISKSTWANWRTSLIIWACLLLAGNGGVTISEQHIDSGLAALIVSIFSSSRRRHTRSVSAFLLNRSSDLCSRRFGGATCDDKSAQIYARFDKNDWRIQPAEFYCFHDAEVNTFGYF